MMWFAKKQPAQNATPLYREPTEEERIALLVEQQQLWREDVLLAGGALMSPWTNVAHGTKGYVIRRMRLDGLLEERREPGVLPDEDRYVYTLSAAGRAERDRLPPVPSQDGE